jgi:two-component system cell cycle response regulator
MAARILVIEDNPANRDLMSYLLRAFGHTVITATDGAGGLAVAARESPDLVVCDLQLPDIDGYEVVRRLAQLSPSRVPIVAVTAFAMVGDRERVLRAGFDGYLSKPIRPESFVAQIEAFLQPAEPPRAETPREEAAPSPPVPGARRPVLVVDNSPANLNLLRSILEPQGFPVLLASGVEEALSLTRRDPPALILSDLHMPGPDGFEFIRRVKADRRLAEVPFVFLSSTVWDRLDEEQALALGAAAFLRRPISTPDLLARLRAWLDPGPGA